MRIESWGKWSHNRSAIQISAAITITGGHMGELQRILDAIQQGTFGFLGLLCFLVFLANAVLLAWLILKKGSVGLARCPKCGRTIACPHCEDDEEHEADSADLELIDRS